MARDGTDMATSLTPGELYRRARRIEALARIIMDCTTRGSRSADSARANQLLKEIGAIAGEGSE